MTETNNDLSRKTMSALRLGKILIGMGERAGVYIGYQDGTLDTLNVYKSIAFNHNTVILMGDKMAGMWPEGELLTIADLENTEVEE